MPAQCRLAFKSASRAYCPYLHCAIVAAGGKLAAVVVPGDGPDTARVTGQRALRSVRLKKKLISFFFNLTNLSDRSAGTQIGEIKKKI